MESSYRGRSYLGNRALSPTKFSRLPQNEPRYLISQYIPNLESRSDILFRGEGCDTSGVQLLEHRIMCELCVYPCLIVENIQCKFRGIIVIMKNYQPLFAKSFDLGSNFNFLKGFLANMLVIITLAALLIFSPKFVVICYQKVFFLYKLQFI